MERTISSNERLRRAEELYQRKNRHNYKVNQARVNVGDGGKGYKLFKKLFLQITACLMIYFAFYTIKNSDYIFSENFLNQVKEVLAYDINIAEIYNNMHNWFVKDEKQQRWLPTRKNQII